MNLHAHKHENTSIRALLHELSSASFSLEAAFRSADDRDERVREARESLEAFQLLERTDGTFTVPRKARRRIEWALAQLEMGRLELADSDIRLAGGLIERALSERWRKGGH